MFKHLQTYFQTEEFWIWEPNAKIYDDYIAYLH